jgi:hypothetical protein
MSETTALLWRLARSRLEAVAPVPATSRHGSRDEVA